MRLLAERDPGTLRVVSDAAGLVGQQLAVVCNLLAPARVVVVGAMAGAGELVLGPIKDALQRNIAPNEPPGAWSSGRSEPGTRPSGPSPSRSTKPTGSRQPPGPPRPGARVPR